jgi:hypothetical protein
MGVWNMRPITVKYQVNDDEFGLCLSIAVYCLVRGLDFCTIPTEKFNNEARLFIFYTVMGFKLDQDDNYDPAFGEDRDTVTIIDDASPGVAYNDDFNRFECSQLLVWAKNPTDLAQAQLRDLVYPDSDGVVEDCEEEDAVDDDGEDYQQQDMNLK